MGSFSIESHGLTVDEIARLASDMWADLPFDREALAALKRDGFALDRVHLGGAIPYRFETDSDGLILVTVTAVPADLLQDLWQVHFRRGIRPGTIAA